MTRGRPAEAPDLHERFGQWLQAGAQGEPARDVAVHAAHCPACRAMVAAWDRLALVDTGRAPMPPSRRVVVASGGWMPGPRAMAATAAGLIIVATGAWIGASALDQAAIAQSPGTPSPDQGVLGGFGAGGSDTPSVQSSRTPDGSPSPSETATATATAGSATATPAPTQVGQPVPTASPRPVTPAPTARPSAATPPPNPTQTISPTQPPSVPPSVTPPSPTASPTPTAVPSAPPSPESSPTPTEQSSVEPSQAP